MKLETKHLAPYLPYNLKCEVLNSGQEKEIGEMIAVYDDNSACFGNIIESEKGFEYILPILKPMLEYETVRDLRGMEEQGGSPRTSEREDSGSSEEATGNL